MSRICNRCGCSSFHYSPTRMQLECDACGAPVYDEQRVQQLMQFDRTYSQALEHIQVGNWDTAISLLRPLLNQFPSEKKLYVALLKASTNNFSNIEMNNASYCSIASNAWDKLLRLNFVSAEMMRYARKRYDKRIADLDIERKKLAKRIFIAAFLSVLAGLLFYSAAYFCGVVCVVCTIRFLYKLFTSDSFNIVRKASQTGQPDYRQNPFQ